jgi:uncharacterized protein (DUF983 family)
MRIFNRYLLLLVLTSCLINIILAFTRQTDIEVCFTILVIAFLIITMLFVYFNPKTRQALSLVSIVFLSGFMVIVALKIIEVMGQK